MPRQRHASRVCTVRTASLWSWLLHCSDMCALLAGREDGSRPEIYLKREDLNHTGAHKINNSLGQALLCRRLGKKRIVAETGAGQHGVATVSAGGSVGHAPALQDVLCGTNRGQSAEEGQLESVCTAPSLWPGAGRFCTGTLSGQHGTPSIWALSNGLSTAAELLAWPRP